MSSIDDYLEHHARTQAPFTKGELSARPIHQTAVVTCMDSRILAARLLGIDEGDAHIIRNAGGVVTDDIIRSLMLSQRVLGTREIMLIQHTGCGLFTHEGEALQASLEEAVGAPLPFDLHTFADVDENVRWSLERIRTSLFLQHTDAARGFVYEVESGRLREVC